MEDEEDESNKSEKGCVSPFHSCLRIRDRSVLTRSIT